MKSGCERLVGGCKSTREEMPRIEHSLESFAVKACKEMGQHLARGNGVKRDSYMREIRACLDAQGGEPSR